MSIQAFTEREQRQFPFYNVSDDLFLSRDDIRQLHDSRYCMLISFHCIQLPPFHCSFRFDERIPKNVARNFYGANHEVTLLHRTSGEVVLLDGCRCYPAWKEAVENKELGDVVVMNVIKETRSLTHVQCLQLATYCNIKSRDTQMKTLWERVYVVFAFYSALRNMMEEDAAALHRNVLCERNSDRKLTISEQIGKGLYLASLFDHQFPQPTRGKDMKYIESCIRLTVRGCLQLVVEDDLMAAITYYCRESPSCSKRYFNRQFFYDYSQVWLRCAPLLKQLLLLFVLPSFPYLSCLDADYMPTDSSNIKMEVRAKMRVRIPSFCEKISCFLCSYIFGETEKGNETGTDNYNNPGTSVTKEEVQLDLPLIHNIAYKLQCGISTAERNVIHDKGAKVDDKMDESVIAFVKVGIMQYSVSIAQKSLHLLYK